MPRGASCLPGTVEHGLPDGQRSSGGSRGWAHPRQATAVAGGVKACRIGLDSVSHGNERSATAGGRLPLLQLQRQRSNRGRPSVGATRRQTAPLTAPGLSKVQRPGALLPGWGATPQGRGPSEAGPAPAPAPGSSTAELVSVLSSFHSLHMRSPLGGHI